MILGKRAVALIPARGGSKSVPFKNIRVLGKKPLLAWSIEAARQVSRLDAVAVSTEDDRIAEIASEYKADVIRRPQRLAQDHSLVIDAIKDAIDQLARSGNPAEYMVLLEPTCPFRSFEDIEKCLDILEKKAYDSVATFVEAKLNPHRAWTLLGEQPKPFIPEADPWQPRQAMPKAFQLNGAVYAFKTAALLKSDGPILCGRSAGVLMPVDRSLDIDTEMDFAIAEGWLKRHG